jgi:hypothetical protein
VRARGEPAAQRNDFRLWRNCFRNRALECGRVLRIHEAGRQQRNRVPHFAGFGVHERIRRRHRCGGYADMHRRQRQQRMFDAVAGEDHERAIRVQLAAQQRVGEPSHLREGRPVGQRAPRVVAVALCQEGDLRPRVRPVNEILREAPRIVSQRLERSKHPAAVGALLGGSRIRTQRRRPATRLLRHCLVHAGQIIVTARRCVPMPIAHRPIRFADR